MTFIVLIILFGSVLFINKKPALVYIIGLFIFFNVGGFIDYKSYPLPGYFNIHDFGLLIAFLAGISINNFRLIPLDKNIQKILIVLFIFTLYQIIVCLIIKAKSDGLYEGLQEFSFHKWRILGVYFILPTYYIFRKNSIAVFKYMLYISAIILALFYLSLIFPYSFIKVIELERGIGQGHALRLSFYNPAFIYLFIYFAFILLLIKRNINNRKLIMLVGFFALLSVFLTITRQSIILVLGVLIIIIIMVKKVYPSFVKINYSKIALYITTIIVLLLIVFPQIARSLYDTFHLSFLELVGKVELGTTQSRTSFEVPKMMLLIKDSPFLGHGFLHDFFWSYHTEEEIGLADVPLLGNIALYGTFGFFIYLLRYRTMYILYKRIVKYHWSALVQLNIYDFILLLTVISALVGSVLFRFFNFSSELVTNNGNVFFGMQIGVFYGITNRLENFNREENIMKKTTLILNSSFSINEASLKEL
jgi:hypothetical protein